MTTLHEDIFRDSKGRPAHDKDGNHVTILYRFCGAEGCEAKLIAWTDGAKDHEGNPIPRPTEDTAKGPVLCTTHGFDALLGR